MTRSAQRPEPAVVVPLGAVLGSRQSVDAARARLMRHQTGVAPVVRDGRPIGLATSALLDEASRFGLGAVSLERLITPAAPGIGAAATAQAPAPGTAPGLLVHERGGVIVGIIETRTPADGAATSDGGRLLARLARAHARIVLLAGSAGARLGIRVHLVGGAVRDLHLRRPIRSLDLAVEGDAERFARFLARSLGARVKSHTRFGTAVLTLSDGETIDVAMTRRESYTRPAALPAVVPATIAEDLSRRDLTINAMALRIDRPGRPALCDPLSGARDLRSRTLRVVHRLSFVEDPTRAFRAARFAARLGMPWHDETRHALALAKSARAFAALSPQRRFRELVLVTQEPAPAAALGQLLAMDLLVELTPGVSADRRLLVAWWRRLERLGKSFESFPAPGPARALLYLGLLLLGAPRRAVPGALAHLGVTGEPAARLLSLPSRVRSLQRALRHPRGSRGRLLRIVRACDAAGGDALIAASCRGDRATRGDIASYGLRLRRFRPLLTGSDLRAMGVPQGAIYGAILRKVREAHLAGSFDGMGEKAARQAAARLARSLARRRRLTGLGPG